MSFVDGRVIRQRMEKKDARMAKIAAKRLAKCAKIVGAAECLNTQTAPDRNGQTLTEGAHRVTAIPHSNPTPCTPDQLDTLRHMLGLNDLNGRDPVPYRNYYCASHNDPQLHELRRLGKVELYRTDERYEWFTCTVEGQRDALASVSVRKVSRGRKRYRDFLNASDANPDLTFREFLRLEAVRS